MTYSNLGLGSNKSHAMTSEPVCVLLHINVAVLMRPVAGRRLDELWAVLPSGH